MNSFPLNPSAGDCWMWNGVHWVHLAPTVEALAYYQRNFKEALTLLNYSANRLLYDTPFRAKMDARVKAFLEANNASEPMPGEHTRRHPKLPNRQADNPSNVQDMPPPLDGNN